MEYPHFQQETHLQQIPFFIAILVYRSLCSCGPCFVLLGPQVSMSHRTKFEKTASTGFPLMVAAVFFQKTLRHILNRHSKMDGYEIWNNMDRYDLGDRNWMWSSVNISKKNLTSISPISSLRNWEVLLQYPFIQLSEEEHRDPSKVAAFGEWGFWRFKLISCWRCFEFQW